MFNFCWGSALFTASVLGVQEMFGFDKVIGIDDSTVKDCNSVVESSLFSFHWGKYDGPWVTKGEICLQNAISDWLSENSGPTLTVIETTSTHLNFKNTFPSEALNFINSFDFDQHPEVFSKLPQNLSLTKWLKNHYSHCFVKGKKSSLLADNCKPFKPFVA